MVVVVVSVSVPRRPEVEDDLKMKGQSSREWLPLIKRGGGDPDITTGQQIVMLPLETAKMFCLWL